MLEIARNHGLAKMGVRWGSDMADSVGVCAIDVSQRFQSTTFKRSNAVVTCLYSQV